MSHIKAAQQIVARTAPGKRILDIVFAAHGWKSGLTGKEILSKMLALNLERTKGRVNVVDFW